MMRRKRLPPMLSIQLAFIAGGTDLIGRITLLFPTLPCHCRGAAIHRVRPIAQYGVDRRQHHAAHPLRLFSR
jgi:hypothetical protein